jgi:hypothetical protein
MSKIYSKRNLKRSASVTSDTAIHSRPCMYYGYTVTVATAGTTSNIAIRDATAAGAGTIIDQIATGTAAWTKVNLDAGIPCSSGLYVDYDTTATGTIYLIYEEMI